MKRNRKKTKETQVISPGALMIGITMKSYGAKNNSHVVYIDEKSAMLSFIKAFQCLMASFMPCKLCFQLTTKLYHYRPSAHLLCFAILKCPALETLAVVQRSWHKCRIVGDILLSLYTTC